MRLRSAQRHKYALPRLPDIYYLFTQDTLDGTNGVRIIEVPLYNLVCDKSSRSTPVPRFLA